MRVQGDAILVKKVSNKVAGSIYIPSFGNMGYCYCEVVAVGRGGYAPKTEKFIPMQVKVGDRTLINQGVLEEYEITKDGKTEKYYWCSSVECLGVFEDNEDV